MQDQDERHFAPCAAFSSSAHPRSSILPTRHAIRGRNPGSKTRTEASLPAPAPNPHSPVRSPMRPSELSEAFSRGRELGQPKRPGRDVGQGERYLDAIYAALRCFETDGFEPGACGSWVTKMKTVERNTRSSTEVTPTQHGLTNCGPASAQLARNEERDKCVKRHKLCRAAFEEGKVDVVCA